MIIVSQDERSIINFDNIEEIYVSGTFISINYSLNNNECIAEYKTEKRAKEVLIGIMQSYLDSENYKYVNQLITAQELDRLQDGLVYEMPKE